MADNRPRVGQKGLIGGLLLDHYALTNPSPEIYWDDQRREATGIRPLIKVYPVSSPFEVKGIGYGYRRVEHHLTVDVQGKDDQVTWNAKEEVIRVLGAYRTNPFAGYDLIEFDDGTPRSGYGGFYRYVIEVTLVQLRKPVLT